ncbi:SDR family NAD(P)-dependent oxidoreductase [Helicovermis profundi]|uniref:SDR family oxidoreductase n=1 Tax=Helicovermis profundi TaxID=3065157 RepID=A0AAU9E4Z0_9FIRM|nr:SDR family oxidoreductase [Clostridia bacterium S502]
MNELFSLREKVAVITGASSGLGADAAKAYALSGAKVALLARRKEKLDDLANELINSGVDAIAVQCDVSNEKSVKEAIETVVKHYGKIDILLNNAGVATKGSVEELSVEDWDKTMNANVKGIYLMSKYTVPHMKKNNYGKIINISSVNAVIADKTPVLARHSYNASKAAVKGLTIGMAASYMQNNITVNAIGPALFESEMTSSTLFTNEKFMNMYTALNPASRAAKKGELNGTIIYLSSDASSYVTGQYILVDGGMAII